MNKALYETDFYAWSQQTAQALREGRIHDVDFESVAEEIADVGKSEERALESRLERIIVHLLKIRLQPERHTRSWDLSIEEARERVAQSLRHNPSLCSHIPELILDAYKLGRLKAARQTGLELGCFPSECPFSAREVTGR